MGDADFSKEERLQVEPGLAVDLLADELPCRLFMICPFLDDSRVDFGELRRALDDAGFGKTNMALIAELLEHITQGGPCPQGRGPIDAEPAGQLVGCLKADAPDVGRQPVR